MKEQFINMVKTKHYPLEWFYQYYHQRGGTPINIHVFMHWFESFELNQLLDNVAKSFGLNRIADKNGLLVLVYEG
jgi:hypothetical protein